jgi:hypothetical protein
MDSSGEGNGERRISRKLKMDPNDLTKPPDTQPTHAEQAATGQGQNGQGNHTLETDVL